MEIRTKHLMLLSGGLAVLVTAALWPPQAFGARERLRGEAGNPLRRSAERLERQLTRTANALHISQRVADALSAESAHRVTDGLSIMIGDGVPPTAADYIRTQMTTHWESVAQPGGVRTIISAVLEPTTGERDGWSTISGTTTYRIVPVTQGTEPACVYLIDIGQRNIGLLESQPNRPARALTPMNFGPELGLSTCAFYAAFGQPGPAIAAWIDATGNYLSAVGKWDGEPASSLSESPEPSYWRVQPRALGCAAGKAGACADVLREGGRQGPSLPGYSVGAQMYYVDLAHFSPFFLGDMVRALGAERFTQFWQSPLPLEAAFESATGESIDRYMEAWAATTTGVPTPDLKLRSFLLAAVVMGMCAAGAGYVGRRRTVG